MDELLRKFADDRGEDVGRGELVNGLSEGDENEGDLELVVGEIPEGRKDKVKECSTTDDVENETQREAQLT